jgi:hypothetical protein
MTPEEWGFVSSWYTAEHAPTTTTTVPPPAPKKVAPKPAAAQKPVYKPAQSQGGGGCAISAYICERESRGNYGAVNPSSGAGGKYQFMPGTWNATAQAMGRPDLVGVPPQSANPADQDAMARYLWNTPGGCRHWSAC